ncbi:MAG: hypothetical protein M5R36_03970 [Deltaproteobacteria bacterium]|nr:hypothetical protein [Deltaproteobacteria bacterium]
MFVAGVGPLRKNGAHREVGHVQKIGAAAVEFFGEHEKATLILTGEKLAEAFVFFLEDEAFSGLRIEADDARSIALGDPEEEAGALVDVKVRDRFFRGAGHAADAAGSVQCFDLHPRSVFEQPASGDGGQGEQGRDAPPGTEHPNGVVPRHDGEVEHRDFDKEP